MNYKDNKSRRVYGIDVDGTLTFPTDGYALTKPNIDMIKAVRDLYFQGHIIIIWTARCWDDAPELISFLEKNSIPYHGIKMGKGGCDIYVDDKMMSIPDFIKPKEE